MKYLEFIFFLLLLFSVKTSFAQDWANLGRFREANEQLESPKEGEDRVVFMGNSITESWLNDTASFFYHKPYINRAIGGQTTPQMLIRFRDDVIDLEPSVVVILAGINDIAGNTGPSSIDMIFDNIKSMAELAKANGIRVVLSSVLPAFDFPWRPGLEPSGKVMELNRKMKAFAAANDMEYLDYFSEMVDERNGLKSELTYDGVHPNLAGYKVMEPLAEKAIRRVLSKK